MSTTAADDTHHVDEHDDHEHPSDVKYIQIAIILAIVTAIEVLTYFVEIGDALIPSLIVMMVVKFWLVAGYFMHLKFDNPVLTRIFVFGLVLAVIVYLIFLSSSEFWTKG